MKGLTIKQYAIQNKIPIFNVVKMIKSNQLEFETHKVEGKDEIFILSAKLPPEAKKEGYSREIDYKKAYFELKAKYDALVLKQGEW